ncbi:murein L,D-transpeptidase catalytic domain family protein [Pseudobacter ginsenosidimutans]|uniref:L,D-transpeptidase-like protein n=1 Tax=Pseudobacter ginsenosidimutans TaxID=661488 RepID=A0A4Q7MMS6_9BACT|nr:murein L,D-transpeptidase catalytic domain family protein [Pseudobacter ginsenosidimutans]QEC45714.1 murein L,D-transpeptidase catalytic domain family protein [Pseudobacter ginsenosidimutans]RZS69347.1 L,D-transpeptidase-like protein [Pseudobacter ginsenosidimutans]
MQKPRKKLRLATLVRATVLGVLIVLHWSFVPFTTDGIASTPLSKKIFFAPSPIGSIEYHAIAWSLSKMEVYDSLHLEEQGLSRTVFQMALNGMEKLKKTGLIRDNILSIADFSRPSSEKRLFVIDLNNYQVLFHSLVAHGNRSGKESANVFSNKPRSNASSLGFYVTGQTYRGSNGYSLKLQGMEKGINDAAFRRAIVVHGADYVSDSWINSKGYIGRSQGCPAVPTDISRPLIDEIKDGTVLFIYHPTSAYISRSKLVR